MAPSSDAAPLPKLVVEPDAAEDDAVLEPDAFELAEEDDAERVTTPAVLAPLDADAEPDPDAAEPVAERERESVRVVLSAAVSVPARVSVSVVARVSVPVVRSVPVAAAVSVAVATPVSVTPTSMGSVRLGMERRGRVEDVPVVSDSTCAETALKTSARVRRVSFALANILGLWGWKRLEDAVGGLRRRKGKRRGTCGPCTVARTQYMCWQSGDGAETGCPFRAACGAATALKGRGRRVTAEV